MHKNLTIYSHSVIDEYTRQELYSGNTKPCSLFDVSSTVNWLMVLKFSYKHTFLEHVPAWNREGTINDMLTVFERQLSYIKLYLPYIAHNTFASYLIYAHCIFHFIATRYWSGRFNLEWMLFICNLSIYDGVHEAIILSLLEILNGDSFEPIEFHILYNLKFSIFLNLFQS